MDYFQKIFRPNNHLNEGITVAYRVLDLLFSRNLLAEYTWTGISRSGAKKEFRTFANIVDLIFMTIYTADSSFKRHDLNRFFIDKAFKCAKYRSMTKCQRTPTRRTKKKKTVPTSEPQTDHNIEVVADLQTSRSPTDEVQPAADTENEPIPTPTQDQIFDNTPNTLPLPPGFLVRAPPKEDADDEDYDDEMGEEEEEEEVEDVEAGEEDESDEDNEEDDLEAENNDGEYTEDEQFLSKRKKAKHV